MRKIFIIFLLLIILTSCSSPEDISEIINTAFNAVKSQDAEEIKTSFSYENEELTQIILLPTLSAEQNYEFNSYLFGNMNFQIEEDKIEVDTKNNKATAEITFSNLDVLELQEHLFNQIIKPLVETNSTEQTIINELEKEIFNYYKTNTTVLTTQAVQITLIENGTQWEIVVTDELLNALTCGLLNLKNSLRTMYDEYVLELKTNVNNATSSGGVKNPDGSVTYPDGSTSYPDGSRTYPDGTITYPNGLIIFADGSTYDIVSGTRTFPSGIVVDSNGLITFPNGKQMTKEELVNLLNS